MTLRAPLFVVALALALAHVPGVGSGALASEYVVFAYLVDPEKLATLIGSGDGKLERRMLGNQAFADDHRLETRFTPFDRWRIATRQLIAGEPRDNDAIEGFVVMLAAETVGRKADPPLAGAPFLQLNDSGPVLRATGEPVLAEFFERLDLGNAVNPDENMPDALKGKLETSDYPMRMSAFSPADAARYGAALRRWKEPDLYADDAPELDLPDTIDEEDADEVLSALADYREELQVWFDTAAKGETLFLFAEGG